ncbi:MAG TPA: alkaline phosphatase family protein [Vicinamibacteria bacterium]|nr:alkaline phosphatase family protein [Vicinamibacteria bacterium]
MKIRSALVLLSALGIACARGNGGGGTPGKRVIILGFDGLDYELTKRLMEEGKLPNFSRAAAKGAFGPLETSIPPQSPVAWSDFITGMDAGGHGIFDFLHRNKETMIPDFSMSKVSPGGTTLKIGKYQFPLSGGSIELLRRGRPFWEVLENHGIETTLIRMPVNFPPSGKASRELSGMGTPDVRGGYGEFSFYTSKLFAFAGEDISGGDVYEVDIYDGVVEAKLYGPDNPFLIETEKLTSDFTVYLDPVDQAAKIVAETEEVVLRAGEWSGWVPVEFPMIPTQTLGGMVRFYLRSVRPDFELYASPVQFDPMAPALPISTPDDYATELAKTGGRFYVQGMPEDTKSRESGVLTTAEFLAQAHIAGKEFSDQLPYLLDQFEGGLLFFYLGNVDQVSHVMWKVLDPGHPAYDPEVDPQYAGLIEELYVELDAVVAQAFERLSAGDTLIVMSDHGFTSWRRSFHLNAWLRDKGYLAVKNPNLEEDPGLFVNVDWQKTRAYGVGFNSLYLNLKGREKNGIVPPEERQALIQEISADLLAEIDPKTGGPVVTAVYLRDETYKDRGELEIGPDIVVGTAKGTRVSGHSALGAVGKEALTDNVDEWSGDHLMDYKAVPGVLLTSRPLAKPAARLRDLAQSVLAEFGIDEPIQPGKEED